MSDKDEIRENAMPNNYLCDLCAKKSADLTDEVCICWAAPIRKVAIPDDYGNPIDALCPWGMFEQRESTDER